MSRRTNLPGAAELFRATSGSALALDATVEAAGPAPSTFSDQVDDHVGDRGLDADPQPASMRQPALSGVPALTDARSARRGSRASSVRRTVPSRSGRDSDRPPSGRERHDEKITVYCSPEELLDLEGARLSLRAEHGLVVDRGRIVREALAVVLADLAAKGDASVLVRRLTGS